jgi:hypothetical protein
LWWIVGQGYFRFGRQTTEFGTALGAHFWRPGIVWWGSGILVRPSAPWRRCGHHQQGNGDPKGFQSHL